MEYAKREGDDIDSLIESFEFFTDDEDIPYIEDEKEIEHFTESVFTSHKEMQLLNNIGLDIIADTVVQVNINTKNPNYIKILNHGLKELGRAAVREKIIKYKTLGNIESIVDEIIETAISYMRIRIKILYKNKNE